MIQTVLFDFDGTLINTNDLIFASYRYAFRKVLNREITMKEILELYGRPLYPSLEKYGEKQEEIYRAYKMFEQRPENETLVKKFDGVYEGIQLLHKHGFLLGIVTSKRMHAVQKSLEFLELTNIFDVIVTPDEPVKPKPSPEPVLLACRRLGIAPDTAVMVGDSVFDLISGREAGCLTCALTYSTTPLEDLKKEKPVYLADSVYQLAERLIEENDGKIFKLPD